LLGVSSASIANDPGMLTVAGTARLLIHEGHAPLSSKSVISPPLREGILIVNSVSAIGVQDLFSCSSSDEDETSLDALELLVDKTNETAVR